MKKISKTSSLERLLICEQSLTPFLLIFSTVCLVSLLILCALAQPIADDFAAIPKVHHDTLDQYLWNSYTTDNGRYSSWILTAVSVKLWGVMAIRIVPVLEIGFLVATLTWTLWQLQENAGSRFGKSLLLSSVFTGVLLWVLPSPFDSLAWFTATTVYVAALDGMALVLGLFIFGVRQARGWPYYLLLFVVTFFTQGFDEPASAILTLAVAIFGVYSLCAKKLLALRISIVGLAGSIMGIAALYFAPGTGAREGRTAAAGFDIHRVFIGALHDYATLFHFLLSWRLTLIIVTATAFSVIIPPLGKKPRFTLFGTGLALIALPPYITGILTHYAGSIEGGASPYRTLTISMGLLVTGVVMVIFTGLQSLPSRRTTLATYLVLYVGAPLALIVSMQPILAVLKAEVLRGSMMEYRADLIHTQLAEGRPTIDVLPAPVLIPNSQAVDISYSQTHQAVWLLGAVKGYYGIEGHKIHMTTSPPPGYCEAKSAAEWWGAYTCRGDASTYGMKSEGS